MKLAAIIADVPDDAQGAASASVAANDRERMRLNNRELVVLRLLVQGLANKEIAAQMEVSEGTIKNTLQQLFAKTNVRTRAQLVRIAFEDYRDVLTPSVTNFGPVRGLGPEARRMLLAHRYGPRRSDSAGVPSQASA